MYSYHPFSLRNAPISYSHLSRLEEYYIPVEQERHERHKKKPIERSVNEGARYLATEVFAGCNDETLKLIEVIDSSAILFILTKAIALHVLNKSKNTSLTKFYTKDTCKKIVQLRLEIDETFPAEELRKAVQNITTEDIEIDNEKVKRMLNTIKGLAYVESRGDLVKLSYSPALELLQKDKDISPVNNTNQSSCMSIVAKIIHTLFCFTPK